MGGVYSVLNQKRGMVFEEMQRPGEGGPCAREACCMTAAMGVGLGVALDC